MSQGPVDPTPRRSRRALVILVGLGLAGLGAAPPEEGRSFEVALPRAPLTGPLEITGGFGEYRIGHFHAGLDFGTGQRVGRRVFACARGAVERIRASGVGYGRSVYLRTDDGRLLQFGHLDAFVEPLASYVRARQDSSGQYEQDLWPEPGRFRFEAGERIAWSGESGAGGPHLHFEIRRGDMAYHPLRAGLAARDTTPPSLVSLTLEPLDDTSYVERGAAPYTVRLGARAETLHVEGRVRAVVGARDGVWHGVDRMVPWSVAMEWNGKRVECRFDSVSWATDMAEGDYLYDAGRVIGEKGLVLWAPAGWRPRMIHADTPLAEEAGTIAVRPGEPPRLLRLVARDVAGNRVERAVVIAPPPGRGPAAGGALLARASPSLTSLPGGWLRVTDGYFPESTRDVRVEATSLGRRFATTRGPGGWTAVLPFAGKRGRSWAEGIQVDGLIAVGERDVWGLGHGVAALVLPTDSIAVESDADQVSLPAGATFETSVVLLFPSGKPSPAAELAPASHSLTVAPAQLPLRSPARLSLAWTGAARGRLGLYRESDDGWEWIAASFDSIRGRIEADTRRLGRFALFADTVGPRLVLRRTPRRPLRGPYSRWAVEVDVAEAGSGLDARASYFVVDGRRVPTEWDAEERTLRWRPARPPTPGTHRIEAIAADRAGNRGRTRGTFVLD